MEWMDRYFFRRLIRGIESLPYIVRRGISNIRRFFWPVWHFEPFDFDGLLAVMECAMVQMRDRHRVQRITSDHERLARQLTVCSELLRRLRADEYFENAGYAPDSWRNVPSAKARRIVDHATQMQKQDVAYFCRTFRHVQSWWD